MPAFFETNCLMNCSKHTNKYFELVRISSTKTPQIRHIFRNRMEFLYHKKSGVKKKRSSEFFAQPNTWKKFCKCFSKVISICNVPALLEVFLKLDFWFQFSPQSVSEIGSNQTFDRIVTTIWKVQTLRV